MGRHYFPYVHLLGTLSIKKAKCVVTLECKVRNLRVRGHHYIKHILLSKQSNSCIHLRLLMLFHLNGCFVIVQNYSCNIHAFYFCFFFYFASRKPMCVHGLFYVFMLHINGLNFRNLIVFTFGLNL